MTTSIACACPLHPSARRRSSVRTLAFLVILAWVVSAAGAAHAAVCRVTNAGTGDGSTWATAAPLQSALADANCDEIWASQGTYLPTLTVDRSISFAINRPLKLYGGFAGGETSLSQRSSDNRLTVLSGDIGVAGDNTDNSRHVVVIGAAGNGVHQRSDTVVDGLSIVDGNVFSIGQYSETKGGGLLCSAVGSGRVCSPTISNVLFRGNSSIQAGGALASMAGSGGVSSPLIRQSTFTGNTASTGGGAVFVYAGTASTANPEILQSSFDGNTVPGNFGVGVGGAVLLYGNLGHVVTLISQSTFNGNSATAASGAGGAIASSSDGGGTSVATITQSTLVGNSATSGGAVHITSSTFDVKSSIVWGNTAATGSQFHVNGGSISVDGSIVEGSCPAGVTCTGAQNLDPQLGVLAFNAGSTKTMMPGLGSPALSVAGSCSASAVDQRGAPRPTSGSCDVGAVQRQLAAPASPTSFVAAAGNSALALSWSPGGGGWPHYEVTDTTGGGSTAVCSTTATTCTVPGLLNGTAYTFSLVARNEAGTSGPATASGTPMTLPDAPTATAATAGNAQATVTWTAPAGNGGSPITGYTVAGTPGGTCTVAAAAPRTCTIATLANGTPYTFTVKATNAVGDSLPSLASAPVTPTAPVVVAPPAEDPGPTSTTINTPGSTTTITNPSLPVVVGPGAGGGTIVLPGTGTTPTTLQVIVNGQPLTVQALPGTQLRIAEVNGQSVLVLVVLEGWASMASSAVGQPMVLAGPVLLSAGSAGTLVEAQPLAVAVQVGSLTAPTGSLPAVGSMGLQAGERLQVNDQGAVVAITLGSLKGDAQQPGDPMAFANLPASISVDNKAFARLNGALARLSGGNMAQGLEVAPSGVLLVRDGGQVFQLLPTQPILIDARLPDGMGFTPLGLLRWVRGGVVVQFAPAVADLAGLAHAVTAALPDATLKLGAEGVLQLRTGGQTYVLRPDWTGSGTAPGAPQIGVDEQGRIYLQTGQGARQWLLPALLNATQASSIFTTALPGAVLSVQAGSNTGALTLTLAGQAWRLVPQWVLPTGSAAQVPPQAGPWWMGADGLLYLKLGTQVQGVRVSD